MEDHGKYQTIGETIDDAAGEAFDKVAKLLDLGYPGGPAVSKLAAEFRNKIINNQETNSKKKPDDTNKIKFPRPLIDKPNFDFSFSGLKTAVLTQVVKMTADSHILSVDEKAEICFAFEEATVDVLCTKTIKAMRKYQPKKIILAGGVAANRRLREELIARLEVESLKSEEGADKNGCQLLMSPVELCGDNAAMIGVAAYYHIIGDDIPDLFSLKVDSNLSL
jgi:N6-L-threonylcarbamoyladenine synthase